MSSAAIRGSFRLVRLRRSSCRAAPPALRPRSFNYGPHVYVRVVVVWSASYSSTLAVPSSRPAHRRAVVVYRPRRRAPSAVVSSAFVRSRVRRVVHSHRYIVIATLSSISKKSHTMVTHACINALGGPTPARAQLYA